MKKIKIFLFSFLFILVGVTAFTHNAYAVTASFSVSNCSIDSSSSWCNVTINWSATGLDGTSVITANYPEVNTQVGSGDSGTATHAIPTYGATFYFKNHDTIVPSTQGITITPTYGGNISSQSCVIQAMKDTCVPHLEWSVKNPSVTPKVTATINGVVNTQIATGVSGSFDDTSRPINYTQNRTYYLYHDNIQLDSVMVETACASGTHWNGSFCSPGYVGISTTCNHILNTEEQGLCPPANNMSVCEIPINGSSCNVYAGFSWDTTIPHPISQSDANVNFSLVARGDNLIMPQTVMSVIGYQNLVDFWAVWLTRFKYTMNGPHGQTFDATYDTKLLESATAWSYCAAGSAWDGTKCSPATFSATDCVIAPNQSTCLSTLDFKLTVNPNISTVPSAAGFCYWYTRDVTSIKTSNGTVVYSTPPYGYCETSSSYGFTDVIRNKLAAMGYLVYSQSGSGVPTVVNYKKTLSQSINYGTNPLSLYNNFYEPTNSSSSYTARGTQLMDTQTPTATCTYGYTWDGNKCSIPAGTFVITGCEIQRDQSSCVANVTWNVQNRAPLGSTSLTIASGSTPIVITGESGTRNFNLGSNLGMTVSNTAVTLTHNGVHLAQYGVPNFGYADCVAGTIWNFNDGGDKCLLDTIPVKGWITASPCVIGIGGSTCQTTLKWRAWKITTNGGEAAIPAVTSIYPGKMPMVSLEENNNPVGVGSSDGTADLITKEQNPYGDFTFDPGTMTLVGATSFGNTSTNTYSTAKYTLPDAGIDYSRGSQQSEAGIVNMTKIKTRTATFRLGVQYDISSFNNMSINTYWADLGSVIVNAVCATGSDWNDVTNTCMSLCASGFTRSLSTNQCVPLTVTAVLKYSDNTAIQTGTNWFSKFVGNIVSRLSGNRTTPVINSGTQVKIEPILSEGFNIDNTVCTLIQNGINGNDEILYTWPKGIFLPYPIFPTNTIKYSITCNDQ